MCSPWALPLPFTFAISTAYDSHSQVMDVMQWNSSDVLRAELKLWTAQMSDVAGCVNLSGAAQAKPKFAITDAGAPELLLLEYLRDRGWAPGRRTRPHLLHRDPDGKVFSLRLDRSNTLYLQCLVALDDLCAKGLAQLHINQALSYYRAILAAPAPGDIPEGLPDVD